MVYGIILAAGKGSRMKLQGRNKTTVAFEGKTLVQYALDLFRKSTDRTVLVLGAYAESILQTATFAPNTLFAHQSKRLGTGHAVKVAVHAIEKQKLSPDIVLIGYGDHMMFYTPQIIKELIAQHKAEKADITFLSTDYSDPDVIAWGRIVRDGDGNITKIVEQKDATPAERRVTEVNPGFYCVSYPFLKQALRKMHKSEATGEYYITELPELAMQANKKVSAFLVPFEYVGLGINTTDQLHESELLYKDTSALQATI